MMQILAENSDQDLTKEEMAAFFKVNCGLGTPVKSKSGKITMVPRSISFAKLPQDEFHAFFKRVQTVVERMMPGLSREARERLGDMLAD